MSLRSLQLNPISTSHYYTSGAVTIQAGVAIAPGVLLQADPDSQIVIRAGACIGIGAILHAYAGVVEVGEGANIGAEVLLIGNVRVGRNACIGAATTIINTMIDPEQIIPPGSLIGDSQRSPTELTATDTIFYPEPEAGEALAVLSGESEPRSPDITTSNNEKNSHVSVYGRVYVNRMFVKMFPNSPSAATSSNSSKDNDDPWDD